MNLPKLELIFNCACDYYEETKIINKNGLIEYIVYINDLTNSNKLFNESGIPVKLCNDTVNDIQYLECYDIKQQLNLNSFKILKAQFFDKHFDTKNNSTAHNYKQVEKLYNLLKGRLDKQRVKILSEIMDVNIDGVENAHDLVRNLLRQTFSDQVTIR